MAAKLAGSAAGISLWLRGGASPYLIAFTIGVLPIWLELLASRLTGVEAGLEKRRAYLVMDAVVDGTAFVLAPALWYSTCTQGGFFVTAPETIFILAGLFRLVRFAAKGMGADGVFHGLPVTYTGYFWPAALALESHLHFFAVSALLLLLSFAMITDKIRIRPA